MVECQEFRRSGVVRNVLESWGKGFVLEKMTKIFQKWLEGLHFDDIFCNEKSCKCQFHFNRIFRELDLADVFVWKFHC